MIKFPVGTHKWVKEAIGDMLEEHPEYEDMNDEELIQKRNDLYWEAQVCFARGNRLESDGDAIEQYVKIRKEIVGGTYGNERETSANAESYSCSYRNMEYKLSRRPTSDDKDSWIPD